MTGSRIRLASAALAALLASGCGGGYSSPGTPTAPTPTPTSPTPSTGTIAGGVTAGSSGVANATVTLSAGGSQTTNAQGQFTFGGVAAGSHTLSLTLPAGFELDAGETATKPVTVAAGETARVTWSARQSSGPSPRVTIQMQATTFAPPDVILARGGVVTWVNAQPIPHTISPSNPSQPGAWASQTVPAQQGFSFSHTFTTEGTFRYDCQVHAGMSGVVRVQ